MNKVINLEIELDMDIGKNGKAYCYAYVNLGYRKAVLTFDKNLISELFDIPLKDLYGILEDFEKENK